ncbi:MAG: hypothetical protein P4L79_16545 [Legionella sp.]|uniref:hypothetical protein n=1 Tax=Legionella sp. TaxID=459 RepID=UPI00284038B5|nr:hypothetical protein [Legionella sp.]
MKELPQNFIVKIHDLIDLVVAPKQNPFSNYEPEYTGKAALPHAIRRWDSAGCKDFSNIIIHLPSQKVEQTDKNKVSKMFYHYIKNRLEENKDNMFLFRRALTRSFRNAIIFLTFCMILVSILNAPSMLPNMPILRSVLTEGFTVIGWVALWRPVELLLNDLGILRKESTIYHKLLAADIQLVPDDSF